MTFLRRVLCVAALLMIVGTAISGESIDIDTLRAKVAAKSAANPDDRSAVKPGVTSVRNNASVTIGGQVATRYEYFKGSISTK